MRLSNSWAIWCLTWIAFVSTLHGKQDSLDSVGAYQRRGIEHFSESRFESAIEDFDAAIALDPRLEARHWQRGIAYYYAGEFQKGVDQFELHQTVNNQDVENAAWHFICKTRVDGIEAAREALIPIGFDSRVPMGEIWKLFAGTGTVEDVLDAAENGSRYRRQQLCYAHLYLGLYFEALNDKKLATQHIELAATTYAMDNYMGMVAQVHLKYLNR